jgi:Lrp/AsnC family transcriptional regulator for asnA, asnC and gidA
VIAGIDEMDLRILDLLQADGRMPFVKIAEQLGVSDTTVRTRVDRLVRGSA